MIGTNYYPIQLTKNQEATIYFTNEQANNPYGAVQATGSFEFVGISKDGAIFAPTTNAPSEIPLLSSDGGSGTRSYGRYKIVLTASEMNADVVVLIWKDTGNAGFIYGTLIIFTTTTSGGGGGGLALTDVVTDINELSSSNPTVGEVLSFLWQYYRKSKKRSNWSLARFLFRG